jgi:hypothetical protein
MPVSTDFHGILLEWWHGLRGFEVFMYGPAWGEFGRNKKANNWAKKLVVGVRAYADSDSVFTFDVPDPSVVNGECGIK